MALKGDGGWSQPSLDAWRELGMTAKHPHPPICSLVEWGGIQEVWSGSTHISKVSTAVLSWLFLGSLVWTIAMAAMELCRPPEVLVSC